MSDVKKPLLPQQAEVTTTTTAATAPEHVVDPEAAAASMTRKSRRSKFQIAAFVLLVSLFWLARTWNCDHEHLEQDAKIPLEVHIMSKCPDARDCMEKLVLPTMSQVADKVNFTMSFIGTYVSPLPSSIPSCAPC